MVRRQARRRYRSGGISLSEYFRARKMTLTFFLFFLCGLAGGSFYAVADSSSGMLLISIIVNSVKLQQTLPFLRVFFQSATQALGILVYLYFAAYCVKGKWLINLVPLIFGLSLGATITSILYRFSSTAILYILTCVFLPKFLEVLLLLALCNFCLRISAGLGGGGSGRTNVFWIFAILLLVFSLLESTLIFNFCHLLNLGL